MKKFCLLAILAILISLCGCSDSTNMEQSKVVGNASGNIVNGGYSIESNGYIYYVNGLDVGLTSDNYLYRVDSDWSNKTLISNDKMHYISIAGDWIYYSNMSDSDNPQFWGKLYKMKLDGTERTKICDNESTYVNVYDGWIYYVNCIKDGDANIFKVKTDGTKNQKICDDNCDIIIVYDGWIYYLSVILDGNLYKGNLFKIKIDGTEKEKLSDDCMYKFILSNHRIFYTNEIDERLYSIDINGQDLRNVTEDLVMDFNTDGNWVYFCNLSDDEKLYKIKQDGSVKQKMNDNRSWNIHIVGEWIYFASVLAENTDPYRIRIDSAVEAAIT